MTSIEELNLEIAQEGVKSVTELDGMIGSSPEEILESKRLKKAGTIKKKKKKKTMLDSRASKSSNPSPSKRNPQYDYSPLTKQKDKMPKRKYPPEVLKLQADQTKVFSGFSINPNTVLSPIEYNDMIIPPPKKPSILRQIFCCESKSKLRKWYIDGDNLSLAGDTYKSVKRVDLTEYEEHAIIKKLHKMYKSAPPLENLTIEIKTDSELGPYLDAVYKILMASNQFEVTNQLKISSLPHERLLWTGPQFIHSQFLQPPIIMVPKINPCVEINHVFKRYIDKGAGKGELVQLINVALKKFEKSTDLQLLHLKLSSWTSMGDEVVRSASNLVWKIGFNLRELVLHFSGQKLTDYGVKEICETIIKMKNKKLIVFGLGFDSRNLEITDNSLQKISETVLSISEQAFLWSFSLVMVSQPITDYGLWCLGQALNKIGDRLKNLVILVGSISGITDKGVQDLVEGVMKCSKNLRSISLGFLSWEITKYGLRIIETNLCSPGMNLEMCHLYYSNQGFQSKKREEYLKTAVTEKLRTMKEIEVFVFLS